MGFLDKVRSQATTLVEAGQTRLAGMQVKKQSDALLLELGGHLYLERSGRAVPGSEGRVRELMEQLAAFEAQYGPVGVTAAVPPPGEDGGFLPGGVGPVAAVPTGATVGHPVAPAYPAGPTTAPGPTTVPGQPVAVLPPFGPGGTGPLPQGEVLNPAGTEQSGAAGPSSPGTLPTGSYLGDQQS